MHEKWLTSTLCRLRLIPYKRRSLNALSSGAWIPSNYTIGTRMELPPDSRAEIWYWLEALKAMDTNFDSAGLDHIKSPRFTATWFTQSSISDVVIARKHIACDWCYTMKRFEEKRLIQKFWTWRSGQRIVMRSYRKFRILVRRTTVPSFKMNGKGFWMPGTGRGNKLLKCTTTFRWWSRAFWGHLKKRRLISKIHHYLSQWAWTSA